LAMRAVPDRTVMGVARFSDPAMAEKLTACGVEPITCDLSDRDAVEALPKAPNVIFMAGRKFGTAGALSLTWAINVGVPVIVAEAFRESRIVVFSSGNIYRFGAVAVGGSTEADPPAPVGEYAQSCLGRERIFEHFSEKYGTPGRIIRLNYAIDMRYGVLYDIGSKVFAGEPVNLTTGNVNVIWQGDANSQILRAFAQCTTPTSPLNVSGPETVSVRAVARAFGDRFGKEPDFEGSEAENCWLVNAGEAARLFGNPSVPLLRMVDWVADWLKRGGSDYGKPTAYDSRDGAF
jgi:nucleoside-diphosphate-sugar epimerase